ncbi:DMT family transporter [Ferrovibrio terrae]|uniref:DMT family transporter n=1 Tax=Ferrovibrio terrae TaxID=2594003 RepID=UPI0031380E3B
MPDSVSRSTPLSSWAIAAMPGVFVLLWSTGFIGAKFGLPYAEPMTFLVLRFAIVTVLLCVFAGLTSAPWPKSWREAGHIAMAGLLLQAVYLGGVFASIYHGVPAGISALIVGIQPLLVAAAAGPVLGETVTRRQWLGLVLGLGGVILVVWTKLGIGIGTPWGYALSVIALVGITLGTLYQKRYCPGIDLRSGTAIQFAATTVVLVPFALLFETRQVQWTGEFLFALGWLCIVLSLGAITLLFLLIRRGAASKVSSLFFLVPPCTALVAWPLFGEQLSLLALIGMAATMLGVALVNIAPKKAA